MGFSAIIWHFSVSEDFNYNQSLRLQRSSYEYQLQEESFEYPLKGSENAQHGFHGDFRGKKLLRDNVNGEHEFQISNEIIITDVRPKDDRDGVHMIIHDPFELPSDKSKNFYTMGNRMVQYLIVPKISKIDETLEDYDPEE